LQLKQFNILIKLLFPMIIGLFLISIISIGSDFFNLEKNIKSEAKSYFHNTSITIDYILEKNIDLMKTLTFQITKNKTIIKEFENNNKDALFKSLSVLFKHYHINHNITHFYLHKKDQYKYLSIHDTSKYKHLTTKVTLTEAINSSKTVSGIEFDMRHHLTLRVVSPVIKDGKVLFYIELGKKIEKIIKEYTKDSKAFIIFTINKKHITKKDFIKWLDKNDKERSFDALENYYILDSSIPKIDKALERDLNKHLNFNSQFVENEGKKYIIHSQSYFDTSNKELGKLFILKDITDQYKTLYSSILETTIITFIIFLITIWYYFKHIKKTESELNYAYKYVQQLSAKDGLTKLYNKQYYLDNILKLVQSFSRFNSYVSFILIDVDNFKKYNDNYGHLKGDGALIQVSKIIKEIFKRDTEYCFRVGGEEFLIVSVSKNEENGKKMAEILCNKIQDKNLEHKFNENFDVITVSIGIVTKYISHDVNIDELYNNADKALYQSKQSGRNKVTVFKEPVSSN